MRSGVGRSPSQFYTRCIKDPNLIPLLVTAGVEFGALRVGAAPCCCRQADPIEHLLETLNVLGSASPAHAGKLNSFDSALCLLSCLGPAGRRPRWVHVAPACSLHTESCLFAQVCGSEGAPHHWL